MRIEEGKFYRTRDGRKVGPMVSENGGEWEFGAEVDGSRTADGTWCAWRADGSFDPFDRKKSHHLDLISEWTDDGPVRTVTRQKIIPGTYDGVEVGSEVTGRPQREVMVRIAPDHGPRVCMDHDALIRAAAVLTALAGALRDE